MIRHYLTFAHQARVLDEALRGWRLAECWSQEKNTLVMRFIREKQSLFVEISLDTQVGYALLREDLHRARRNTIDFFGRALGVQLRAVTIDEGERVIRLMLADGQTLALFFFGGGGGNALLLDAGGTIGEYFTKYTGEYDAILTGTTPGDERGMDELRAAIRSSTEPPLRAVMRALPELGRRLAAEALYRSGLAGLASLAGLDDATLDNLLEEIDVLHGQCESTRSFYLYYLAGDIILALTRLQSLEASALRVEMFDEIGRAIRAYRVASGTQRQFASLRDRMLKRLITEKDRMERSLANRLDAGSQLERAAAWELEGNLLMSNMHAMERGAARVRLADWEGGEREITLDPKLTPLENAERLFRRARGAREAASRGEHGIEKNRARVRFLGELLEKVSRAETAAALEAIEQHHREIFGMSSAEAREPGTAERFRRFEVAGGHEVYAGKNASNNDELTVRFARPNDYWFHARGSSGSHVVLRWSDTKSKPPKETLRQAASIAAYYSGARGAKMVPVAYTLKKHVRKPRGAAVGAVIMEREEVIMVEPKLPAGGVDD